MAVLQRRPWELLVLLAILALAAWLRLRHLDLVEFKLDEARAIDLARAVLDGDPATVGQVSSIGALNPPLFVYLTAIPLVFRDDPLAATAFIGVLAVAAVALTYAVLRPRFGALAALVAAALFASAPWAVLYGRKIWAQDALPVFTVSLLWSLFLVLEHRRSRAVLAVPVLLCLAFQLNFSALALVVPAAAVLLYRVREVHWRAFAAGAGIAFLLLAPWLVHEVDVGGNDVIILAREGRSGTGGGFPGAGSVEAILETTRLVGGAGWDYVTGPSQTLFETDAGWAWTLGEASSLAAIALLGLGVATSAVWIGRGGHVRRAWPFVELDTESARRALLLAWLAGIWLSYAFSATTRVFSHYLIVSYPVTFAVQAVGVSDLVSAARSRLGRSATVGAVVILAAIVTGFLAFTLSFHSFLDREGGTTGDYGIVYRDKAALARVARERGIRFEDEVLDFLVTGEIGAPAGAIPPVGVRDVLRDPTPLPCSGDLRSFGPLATCLPPSG
jgi:4-amino-4-deoxy-L-arabinose transferase-like glycosyltransferase